MLKLIYRHLFFHFLQLNFQLLYLNITFFKKTKSEAAFTKTKLDYLRNKFGNFSLRHFMNNIEACAILCDFLLNHFSSVCQSV